MGLFDKIAEHTGKPPLRHDAQFRRELAGKMSAKQKKEYIANRMSENQHLKQSRINRAINHPK